MLPLMDSLSFFLHWLSAPLQIGAVAPSSQALAAVITTEIAPEIAPVIELGPGSGAFTRALLDRGIPQRRLALIEQSPRFAFALREQFPAARVLCVDAAALRSIDVFPGEAAGAVVSGLPLLLMSPNKVRAILESAFMRLRPDGAFYQFTYGSRSPVACPILDGLGLTATRIGGTFVNIPPAAVYRIARHPAEPCVFQTQHEPGRSKPIEHRAAPSLLHAAEWPASNKEFLHGIRKLFKQQQWAFFRSEGRAGR
jgi:phosphatidylethanolamine/phosphatidyl-N-methylethanolamine N-methyltransferase